MIAVNHSLEADVDALVDQLARERRALVPTETLRSRLEWDSDRFADAAAEAEDEGRCQSWDGGEEGGELALILTTLEAERRKLVLSAGGNGMRWRWTRVGTKDHAAVERDRAFIEPCKGMVQETALDGEVHGLEFIHHAPTGRPTPLLELVGDEVLNGIAPTDAGHYLPRPRRKVRDNPKTIRDGHISWPLPGTRIVDWPIGHIGKVREMIVTADTCPACGSTRQDRKVGCLACEHFDGERRLMEQRREMYDREESTRLADEADARRQDEQAKEMIRMLDHVEFDPATGRRVIRFQPKAPKREKAVAR